MKVYCLPKEPTAGNRVKKSSGGKRCALKALNEVENKIAQYERGEADNNVICRESI